MDLIAAASNVVRKVRGGVADLRRMPRDPIADRDGDAPGQSRSVLHRYRPIEGVEPLDAPPVLLVPPLGAPDFAYDLRRGCSLVEHLLGAGRAVYLVDYGGLTFADRRRGIESWVDGVVPWAVRETARDSAERGGAGEVHLIGWSLGGIFCLLALAAARSAGAPLPVRALVEIASPVDIAAVPLVAPVRPVAAVTGGRVVSAVYRAIGSFPSPIVSAAFRVVAFDKVVTKPLTQLSLIDDADGLAQIEAVEHLMNHMHAYPGRVFGQIYHLLLRNNDLADGRLALAGRTITLAAIAEPVLVIAGTEDVIAPLKAVQKVVELLTASPDVRFTTAPGGHLGVLTGRRARTTTWPAIDAFLTEHG
ncbi:polyhydroxyalkanoate synthase [Pseudonocardia thermophila]|uniref:Polyhydroxyalkanoate synthase n=1 Tax=Pseudonocardia thermophila TaxID=1848 RepID=A0A1M6TXP2_PSETH|nr:alpha/beta fold hydrolase [Pseudonocardia thermophila]SHK61663.1 polyhydroxyalkanoate synthase [Pseudonocardia thermophila]